MSSLIAGFLLGWSVAWPPGPINAEAIRRALAKRVWQAYCVVLGGCVGDALWALLFGLGVTHLHGRRTDTGFGWVSFALLLLLAGSFFCGAWRRSALWRSGKPAPPPSPLETSAGSFTVGMTLALTSPWNLAFWLAVMGHQSPTAGRDFFGSVVLAGGVILGAATWGVILCVGVSRLARTVQSRLWEILTQLVTGLVMLVFAVQTATHLLGN